MKKYFITGIGTDIGKTIVSAILAEYLQADYWKPVQAGELDSTDTMKVRQMVSNTQSKFQPETYLLKNAMSPHAAAELENIEIDIEKIKIPDTGNEYLLIEGAGGLMVPLNKKHLVIDLIKNLEVEVILVSKNYLGSINHTLLSIEALKQRNIPIKGIVLNGTPNPASEEAIRKFSSLPILFRVPELQDLNKEVIKEFASALAPKII